MKRDRLRTILKNSIRLTLLVLFIIATILLYYTLDRELEQRMEQVKKELLNYLEEQIGRDIEYDSVSPSIFMYLEIRNLVIRSKEDPTREVYRLRQVRVAYNIFKLFDKRSPLYALSSIEIANTNFRITDEPDKEKEEIGGTFIRKVLSSPYDIVIKGRKVNVEYSSGDVDMKLGDLFFTLEDRTGAFEVNVRKGFVNLNLPGPGEQPVWVTSRFSLKGRVSGKLDDADMRMKVLYLSSSYANLSKQTFQLVLNGSSLELRKIQDKAAIDLLVNYNLENRKLALDFKTQNFRPREMIQFTGPFYHYNNWLNTKITASGGFSFTPGKRDLIYRLEADMVLDKSVFLTELDISTRMAGDLHKVDFDRLLVRTNLGTVDFTGNVLVDNFYPEGIVELVNVQAMPGKAVNAAFDVIRSSSSISLRGSRLVLGSSGFDLFNIDLFPRGQDIHFNLMASLAGGGEDNMATASGIFSFQKGPELTLEGGLRDVPVNAFYKLISPRQSYTQELFDSLSPYLVNSFFELDFNKGEFVFSSRQVKISDLSHKDNEIFFALEGAKNRVVLKEINSRWASYAVAGTLEGDFSSPEIVFSSDLRVEGIPFAFKGSFIPGETLEIEGAYGLKGLVDFREKDLRFRAGVTYFPFPVKNDQGERRLYYFTFDFEGSYSTGEGLVMRSEETVIYDFPLLSVKHNSLAFDCIVTPQGVELRNAEYRDGVSRLTGEGRIDSLEAHGAEVRALAFGVVLNLKNPEAPENYSIEARIVDSSFFLSARYNHSPVVRLGKIPVSGTVSGTAVLAKGGGDSTLDIQFVLDRGKVLSESLEMSGAMQLSNRSILVKAFDVKFLDHRLTRVTGKLDFASGALDLGGLYRFNYFGTEITSRVNLSGGIENINPYKYLDSILVNNFEGNLRFSNILLGDSPKDSWQIFLKRDINTFYFQGGPEDVLSGSLNAAGRFYLRVREPFPLTCILSGRIRDKKINATINQIRMDLKIFNRILGGKVLRFTSGYAEGQNIIIDNNLNDPDFYGNLRLLDVKLKFFLFPEESVPFSTNLFFQEKVIRMSNVTTSVGRGSILCNGLLIFDHWVPGSFDLFFQTDESYGTHVKSDFGPLRVNGYTIGSLRARGSGSDIMIDGNLKVNYCDLTLNNTSLPPPEENPSNLRVNLEFTSGVNLQFYWPDVTFPVLNCYANQGAKINLVFDSGSNAFKLTGDVKIQGGEIYYFDSNFRIRSGNILFNEQGGEFDPRLTIEASKREIGDEGEDVTIFLETKNNRISAFNPRLRSVPTMTENEIIALLGGSLRRKIEEGGLAGTLAVLSFDVLSQFGFFRPLEQQVKEALNLDIFSIRTPLVQNMLEEQLIKPENDNEGGDPNLLGKYLDNTTITIGQNIGNDLFFTGLLRLRNADTLPGEGTTNSGLIDFGVVPELEFSLEWPTPFFFTLEWSFNPKTEHMDDFFLTDNAIKLEWNYSY